MKIKYSKGNELILAVFFFIGILSCDSKPQVSDEKQKEVMDICNIHYTPQQIIDYDIDSLFEEAKWKLYLAQFMNTPLDRDGNKILKGDSTFGSLCLIFDSFTIKSDTISFYFEFYDPENNDTISAYSKENMSTGYANGAMFYKGMKPQDYCLVYNQGSFKYICTVKPKNRRYDDKDVISNPNQLKVKEFIAKNKHVLNDWFLMKCYKKGIL